MKNKAAKASADAWRGKGDEEGETLRFWTTLLRDALASNVRKSASFSWSASGRQVDFDRKSDELYRRKDS